MKHAQKPTIQATVVVLLSFLLITVLAHSLIPEKSGRNEVSGVVERGHQESDEQAKEKDPEEIVAPDPVKELKQALQDSFGLNPTRASNFAKWIHEAHLASGVPIGYMVTLVATESSFRYEVVSHAGAVGPAQVTPKWWSEWCGTDLYDPRENVICGAKVLAYYRDQCEDWVCAFKKYNVGPSGYQRAEFISAMRRYMLKIDQNLEIAGEFGFVKKG
jgi:hypothetical protein